MHTQSTAVDEVTVMWSQLAPRHRRAKRITFMTNKLVVFLMVSIVTALGGCSSKIGLFVTANVNPLSPNGLVLSDGYRTTYYTIQKGNPDNVNTLLFFVPGSGHASLNYYIRSYFKELYGNVEIFSLQKRHISHRETGLFEASEEFHRHNHFFQWVKDQKEFINEILQNQNHSVKNVVIFGVSEGGNSAAALASAIPQITHLIILGSGGMKGIDSFRIWGKRNNVDFDKFYKEVQKNPESVKKRGFGQTYKYWTSTISVDPMDYLAELEIPILVASGVKDEMSPVESAYFLSDEFKRLHKQNLTVKVFPDCNHMLIDSDGKSHRKELFKYAVTLWNSKR